MASIYVEFEKDYSELHVISDIDLSPEGPLELYYNDKLQGSFADPAVNGTYSTTLAMSYVQTTFGGRYVFTITPTMIGASAFSDGIWHVVFKGSSELVAGDPKMKCLWCALAKMLNGDCDSTADVNIVNKIHAYMVVAEGATRVKEFEKAYSSYSIAKGYADPYNCDCTAS